MKKEYSFYLYIYKEFLISKAASQKDPTHTWGGCSPFESTVVGAS